MKDSGLEPLDDLAAIPPSVEAVEGPVVELQPEGADALRAAGWRFVRSDLQIPGLRAVYRDSSGRISVEGATVAVRFEDDTDEGTIDQVLRAHDLEVRRPIRFVPKGFQVALVQGARPSERGQLVEISRQLELEPSVTYADPDFVEHIAGR